MKNTEAHSGDADYIVVIGASAGGLQAFKDFLVAVGTGTSMAYVVLQHLDPSHKSLLPELLQASAAMPVVEISEGLTLEPDTVYVLPSHAVPLLQKGVFSLKNREKSSSSVHLLDDFFKAVAAQYGSRAIGVLLSGTGSDGTMGLKAIKDSQGMTFAQDVASAKWPGMPQHAIDHGAVDFKLSPAEIARKIIEINLPNAVMPRDGQEDHDHYGVSSEILQLLQKETGMDFSGYKNNTILRRINRRAILSGSEKLSEYLDFLKNDKNEIDALCDDFLIPVTQFFRDRPTFEFLNEQIFPKLIAGKETDDSIRIWVAGCSTGQEAYSIAMCLMDYLHGAGDDNPYGETYTGMQERIKIFATDLSAKAIARARKGIYKNTEMEGIDEAHRQDYFTQSNSAFLVNKDIRKMCVFAQHDFLNDFPFGNMDMVSCRNVLIYLNSELQQKALTNFNYALTEKGILLLGNSETVSSAPKLFNGIDKGHKIYRRSDGRHKTLSPLKNKKTAKTILLHKNIKNREPNNITSDTKEYAEELLLEHYTPVAIVVDESLNLVSVHGKAGSYLEHTSGKASNNILKLAKGSLGFEIRRLVKNFDPEKDVKLIWEDIKLDSHGKHYNVCIEVSLLKAITAPHYLVVFKDEEINDQKSSSTEKGDKNERRIASLEQELLEVRDELLQTNEEHQIAQEELQSANEELMSGTEELQTLNEELETSKEELQSTVEEITVVNQELNTVNALLNQEKKFSEAIVRTIRDPLLVLNENFEVLMANRSFYKNFQVHEAETLGRSIYDLGNGQWDIPKLHTLLESILPSKQTFTDYEVTHTFQDIGERTLLLNGQVLKEEEHSEGSIFISFEDITARKKAQQELKESIYTHREFVKSSPWPIAILKGKELKIDIANESMLKVWRKNRNVMGLPLKEALPELADQGFFELLDQVYESGRTYEAFENVARFVNDKGEEEVDYFDFVYQPQLNMENEITGISTIATVVTAQVLLNEKIKKSEKQFKQLTNQLPQLITSYDTTSKDYYYNKSWADFTGLGLEFIYQEGWDSLVHPEDHERLKEKYEESKAHAVNFEIELRLRNREGDYVWFINRTQYITDGDGKILRWVGTNTQIQRLKDEEKRKEDFLKLVSHELKTPVTSIKGYVQMLLGMIAKDGSKPVNAFPIQSSLARIDNQVTRLTHLIAELLDLSRMNESKLNLNLEEFDMSELVKATILDVQHSNGMVQIDAIYGENCRVRADMERMGQVLINFINNAIKYSPETKDIRVKVYQEGTDTVSVSIKDSGIGIKAKDLSRIFDRFYRVSGKNEGTYSGFGIGLFLAKEIIDRHNGTIRVESKLGKGSNFIFSLPKEK